MNCISVFLWEQQKVKFSKKHCVIETLYLVKKRLIFWHISRAFNCISQSSSVHDVCAVTIKSIKFNIKYQTPSIDEDSEMWMSGPSWTWWIIFLAELSFHTFQLKCVDLCCMTGRCDRMVKSQVWKSIGLDRSGWGPGWRSGRESARAPVLLPH